MADENVPVSAPEASAVDAPAQPAQGLPEGIAERAAVLTQGQSTTPAPANPPVEAPAPKAAPESYGSLQEMIGDELKADPQAGVKEPQRVSVVNTEIIGFKDLFQNPLHQKGFGERVQTGFVL